MRNHCQEFLICIFCPLYRRDNCLLFLLLLHVLHRRLLLLTLRTLFLWLGRLPVHDAAVKDASTLLFTQHRLCTVDTATRERWCRPQARPLCTLSVTAHKQRRESYHTSVSRPLWLSRLRSARDCPSVRDSLSSGLSGESETKPISALVLDACPEEERLAAWPGPRVTSCTVVHRPAQARSVSHRFAAACARRYGST